MRKEKKKLDVEYNLQINLPSKWVLFLLLGVNVNFKRIFLIPSFYFIGCLFFTTKNMGIF